MKKAEPQIKISDFRKGRAFPHIGGTAALELDHFSMRVQIV